MGSLPVFFALSIVFIRFDFFAYLFEAVFQLTNYVMPEIYLLSFSVETRDMFLFFPEFHKVLDVLTGQISISFLHDIDCDSSQCLVIRTYCSFYLLVFQTLEGLIFDELDFFFEFFEESLQLYSEPIPGSIASSHEVFVFFFEGLNVKDAVSVSAVILVELFFGLLETVFFAVGRGADVHCVKLIYYTPKISLLLSRKIMSLSIDQKRLMLTKLFEKRLLHSLQQNMLKKYIIQIEQSTAYPFERKALKGFQYIVRVSFTASTIGQSEDISHNLKVIQGIQRPYLIKIQRVNQIKGKCFTVDYEYVSACLSHSEKMADSSFVLEVKAKINQVFRIFSQHGIVYFPKLQQIGLTEQGEFKLFLPLNHETNKQNKKILLLKYQRWTEKLFSQVVNLKESGALKSENTLLSDHSHQMINQKINELEMRINQIRVRRKSSASDDPQKSSRQKSEKEKKINMVLQYFPTKKLRNNSQDITRQLLEPVTVQRYHRSSVGDASAVNHKEEAATKDETTLTQRIYTALEKSQEAVKMYTEFRKKNGY